MVIELENTVKKKKTGFSRLIVVKRIENNYEKSYNNIT